MKILVDRKLLEHAINCLSWDAKMNAADYQLAETFFKQLQKSIAPFAPDMLTAASKQTTILIPEAGYDGPWLGCGECDVSFQCHNGEQRCMRLPETPKIWRS